MHIECNAMQCTVIFTFFVLIKLFMGIFLLQKKKLKTLKNSQNNKFIVSKLLPSINMDCV